MQCNSYLNFFAVIGAIIRKHFQYFFEYRSGGLIYVHCTSYKKQMSGAKNNEIVNENDPYVKFYDERFAKSREYLIFMEESKIWQDILEKCTLKAGPSARNDCKEIFTILNERIKYYNSKYRKEFRPILSPGIDPKFEK